MGRKQLPIFFTFSFAMLRSNPSSAIFEKNLCALSAVGEEDLVIRLKTSQTRAPLEIFKSKSGLLNLRLTEWNRTTVHDKEYISIILKKVETIPKKRKAFVLSGVGLGYELAAILTKFNNLEKIFAYERYPEILRFALSLRDYSKEILTKKITFLLGTDMISRLSSSDIPTMILHPVLGHIYEEEHLWWEKHRKIPSTHTVGLINSQGLLARDIIYTLLNMGIMAYPIDLLHLSEEEISYQIKKISPHFVMTINYVKGLPEICYRLGIPCVIWEIDPTIEILSPSSVGPKGLQDNVLLYTYRLSRVEYFKNLGFSHVSFLPLGTNPEKYHPIDIDALLMERYGADVSYVGSSMYDQGKWGIKKAFKLLEQHGYPRQLEKLLFQMVRRQMRNIDRFVLPNLLEMILSRFECPRFFKDEKGRIVDIVGCLSEEIASVRRFQAINTLSGMARKKTIRVWGDEGWKEGLDPAIIYSGPAGHFHEVPIIYNASSINLDINRIYQKDIVPLRVFDILACEAFVLADDSRELGRFFKKGYEIVSYRKLSQIPEICSYYLRHERERREIAKQGRERVLREHTLERRLLAIIHDLEIRK
ncbi:MAG: glycosyltransferase [Deltaproteobacteria bacterium]|nr:glycosyltransferase [Deltaproteobacteria bacterium]